MGDSHGGQSRIFHCNQPVKCQHSTRLTPDNSLSTADQTCARQERDLRAFAKKAGYKVVGVWKETASGGKDERAERKKVLALAQARNIDVILVTELTRW